MRDDFTKRIKDTLADRAGNRCSNPNCRKPTSGPRSEPTQAINVGEAAHISAASPGAARYDPSLTSEERSSIKNGIWLCRNCAKLIDNDPDRYPVDLLRAWKEQAEQAALQEIEHGFVKKILHVFTGDTKAQRALRNRQAMLQLVKNIWVKGVLEQSLQGTAMIELGMEKHPDAVERPWDMVVETTDEPSCKLSRGTKIIDAFDQMNQSLLILGEPGSGKTTMLLELARETIIRAERDPTHLIPVVFNLSSWSEKEQPIADWLVDELGSKYNVATKVAREWVDNDELLFLLDGLDEVKTELRAKCAVALNEFLKHSSQIAVCSRTADYETAATKLNLFGAVLLQPLDTEQIDGYLASAGSEFLAVRGTLQHDPALRELAQTPLMLNVMTLAYHGMRIEDLQPLDTVEARRRHMFGAYVDSMLERRQSARRYSSKDTLRWLSWLAQSMERHAQSIFLIERIQCAWLQTRIQRALCPIAVGVTVSLILIVIYLVTGIWPTSNPKINRLTGLEIIALGVSFGPLFELLVKDLSKYEFESLAESVEGSDLPEFLKRSYAKVVSIPRLSELVRWSYLKLSNLTSPTELLRWSWKRGGMGLVLGALVSVIGYTLLGPLTIVLILFAAGGIEALPLVTELLDPKMWLTFGFYMGLAFAPPIALGGCLLLGLSSEEIQLKTAPNQGMRQSAKNALIVALGGGLFLGLGIALLVGLLSTRISGIDVGISFGYSTLRFTVAASAPLFGFFFGGRAVVEHYSSRFILYCRGCLPWNLARFLDSATERIFLRKVGGGYIFVHPLLQEHFASLWTEETQS